MLYNWLPLTASVESAEILPGATFVIVRSLPLEPTLTVLGALATEPLPRATEFVAPANTVAPVPNAEPLSALTAELAPNAAPLAALTAELAPNAEPFIAVEATVAPAPTADAFSARAFAFVPIAVVLSPSAWE